MEFIIRAIGRQSRRVLLFIYLFKQKPCWELNPQLQTWLAEYGIYDQGNPEAKHQSFIDGAMKL